MHKEQSLINHVALVLDASWSMRSRAEAVIKATNEQIMHLADKSKELNQETRVSVYRFGGQTIECLIFDMDVARLPSASDLYEVLYENTSLIDATMKSQEDLATTSQIYGDHAFLTFVLTDGQENNSKRPASLLKDHIQNSAENWSLGFLVPDDSGRRFLSNLGVLNDSVAIWSLTPDGLAGAASKIRNATDNFMTARASGVRGTRSVFGTGSDKVNDRTVSKSLQPLAPGKYMVYPVDKAQQIRDFVESKGLTYVQGNGYYPLTKRETIQSRKAVVVVERATDKAYTGAEARHLIGLPDGENVRVSPDDNPRYDVYIQSTSVNRKLVPGTLLLVIK